MDLGVVPTDAGQSVRLSCRNVAHSFPFSASNNPLHLSVLLATTRRLSPNFRHNCHHFIASGQGWVKPEFEAILAIILLPTNRLSPHSLAEENEKLRPSSLLRWSLWLCHGEDLIDATYLSFALNEYFRAFHSQLHDKISPIYGHWPLLFRGDNILWIEARLLERGAR